MKVRAAADYDCGNTLDGKQVTRGSAGERDSKIMSNPFCFQRVVILNCDQFGVGMGEERRDVGERRPPSRPNDSAFDLVLHRVLL
jgi:hypothetical protein